MQQLVLIFHVLLSFAVIGLVLVQQGKGADAGAAFGSGASATVFGARGSNSFLTRITTLAVVLFFITSIGLFIIAANRSAELGSVIESLEAPAATGVEIPEDAYPAPEDDIPVIEDSDAAAPVVDIPAVEKAAVEQPSAAEGISEAEKGIADGATN